jgi:hypothetical protein
MIWNAVFIHESALINTSFSPRKLSGQRIVPASRESAVINTSLQRGESAQRAHSNRFNFNGFSLIILL